ncbi:site-specific integrase [Methylicorpusculum oleiharenae]|nr:site-specific integrase [Methylicorpusculum oleiharenae]
MKDKTGSNHSIWLGCKVHLKKYAPDESLSFEQITAEWITGARDYLEKKATGKTGNKLSKNTASTYFNKLRTVINTAATKGILHRNPLTEIPGIKAETSERVYLSIEEVRALAVTDCRYEVLKRGFLFSCVTGLRWSDIQKLDWEQVSILNGGHRITFSQQKTKTLQYLDITPQAFKLMGEQQKAGRVFEGLRYSNWMNVALLQWCMAAGISKHVTFHAGRHTFAVSLLSNGTDIYTVSKLLGHSEVKTTQIYADVIDSVRRDAMHKIPDIGLNYGG